MWDIHARTVSLLKSMLRFENFVIDVLYVIDVRNEKYAEYIVRDVTYVLV